MSIWANGVHGNNRPLSDVETFIVGSIAPIALLASTHLLVLILTSPDEGLSDAELVKIQKRIDREAQAAQVALTAPAAAQTPPAAKAVTATPAANLLSRDQAAERARKQFEQNNSWPTGAEIATWIGKSPKTGMRLLADLKREVDSGVSV